MVIGKSLICKGLDRGRIGHLAGQPLERVMFNAFVMGKFPVKKRYPLIQVIGRRWIAENQKIAIVIGLIGFRINFDNVTLVGDLSGEAVKDHVG